LELKSETDDAVERNKFGSLLTFIDFKRSLVELKEIKTSKIQEK
jgi:hypothetical protein